MEQLAELLKTTPREEIAKLLTLFDQPLPRTRKSVPAHSRVIQRKVITVHHHCRNCDHSYIYTTELTKGQSKSYVRKDGTVGVIMVKADFSPLTVSSWANSCDMCKVRISSWSREKLEERYMQLLCRLTFDTLPATTNDWYKEV